MKPWHQRHILMSCLSEDSRFNQEQGGLSLRDSFPLPALLNQRVNFGDDAVCWKKHECTSSHGHDYRVLNWKGCLGVEDLPQIISRACVHSFSQLLVPKINNWLSCLELGEMFQVALSSFSHLTFSAADIMHEKIFCKSMETALFINPLFNIRLYICPITIPALWYFRVYISSLWDVSYIC